VIAGSRASVVTARRVALALAGAVLVVAIFVMAGHREASPPPSPARPVAAGEATPRALPRMIRGGIVQPQVAAPEALPGSLDGTEADGAIAVDAAGHLVISLELRRLFDHFLAATGEEPLATIRARIIAVLHDRLPATAAGQAIEILDRYLAYRGPHGRWPRPRPMSTASPRSTHCARSCSRPRSPRRSSPTKKPRRSPRSPGAT